MSETFNYIAFGNRAHIEGDEAGIGMSRGRMFEYLTANRLCSKVTDRADHRCYQRRLRP